MIPDIQLIVFNGRGDVNPVLKTWMRRFARVWLVSTFIENQRGTPIADQRNVMWQKFLSLSDLPWCLMIDDDMVPTKLTEPLLVCKAGVCGARYWGRAGHEVHTADGDVGCGALKLSRLVGGLLKLADPFSPAPDECECQAISRNAREAGLWPVKRGRIGHCIGVYVMPGPESDGDYRIVFPDAASASPPAGPIDQGIVAPPTDPIRGQGQLLVLPDGLVDGGASKGYNEMDVQH